MKNRYIRFICIAFILIFLVLLCTFLYASQITNVFKNIWYVSNKIMLENTILTNKSWPIVQFPFHPSHPVKCTQGNMQYSRSHNHTDIMFAIDLSTIPGSPPGFVHAAKDGTAYIYDKCRDTSHQNKHNDDSCGAGYGNHVRIVHEGGYLTIYAHLSKILISNEIYVRKGQVIGIEGNSGKAGFRHLHFGLHKPKNLSKILKEPGWVGKSIPFNTKIKYEGDNSKIIVPSFKIKCDQNLQAPLIYGIWSDE